MVDVSLPTFVAGCIFFLALVIAGGILVFASKGNKCGAIVAVLFGLVASIVAGTITDDLTSHTRQMTEMDTLPASWLQFNMDIKEHSGIKRQITSQFLRTAQEKLTVSQFEALTAGRDRAWLFDLMEPYDIIDLELGQPKGPE